MSPGLQDSLRHAWAVLGPPISDDFNSFPLEAGPNHNFRVAIDSEGNRHLLIETSSETQLETSSGASLSVSAKSLAFAGKLSLYLDLSCTQRDLYGVFDDLIAEVLPVALTSENPSKTVLDSLDRWRALFRIGGADRLDKLRRMALLAELVVLEKALELNVDVISCWTGPFRMSHDFELPVGCLEVKALGATSESIRVHGLEQMSGHDGRPLSLVMIVLAEDVAGISLGGLIGRIGGQLSNHHDFEELLGRAGWTPHEDDEETWRVLDFHGDSGLRRRPSVDGRPGWTRSWRGGIESELLDLG